MKTLFILLNLLFTALLNAAAVSGYVTDRESGETIIGANIFIEGTSIGSSTDIDGFFVIHKVPPGQYELHISYVGYTEFITSVEIGSGDLFLKRIELIPETLTSETINITAHRPAIVEKEMDIGSLEIRPETMKEIPQIDNDVFKLIKLSPSVTISDPISTQFYVRGSDPGENLVQLDGMTIYNPQHMLAQQAIFNPYAIKNIEMLMGGFDAEHGGRNSSILYITSREGHRQKVKGEFHPSISGMEGAVEFPAGRNGTAMISGRVLTSLVGRILMDMPNALIDFNGAYLTRIGNTRLRLSAFYARDYIDYDFKRLAIYFKEDFFRDYSTGFLTDTDNRAFGLQTRTQLLPKLVAETQVYYSSFDVDNKTFFKFKTHDDIGNVDVILNYETRIINRISDITAKGTLSWYTFLNQIMKLGVEYNTYEFYNRTASLFDRTGANNSRAGLESAFIQDQIDLGPLRFKIGLRTARFSPENRLRYEPRTSFALNMGKITFKAAWGKYYQYLTAMNTQDYEISQSVDYYYPLRRLKPLASTHYILGVEGQISDKTGISLSTYYKDLPTLYRFDYNDNMTSILAYNATLERGKGVAYGAELLLNGEINRFSGWLGYAVSRSARRYPSIQQGKEYLYDGDQTHNLKMLLLYKLTKDISVSSTFQLTSGYPKTWETGNISHYSYDPVGNSFGVFPEKITPAKNNVRYPSRILLDLGWKKKLRSGFGYRLADYLGSDDAYFTMSVKNILFLHRNPYVYFYIPDFGYYGFDFNFMPFITAGYSIRF